MSLASASASNSGTIRGGAGGAGGVGGEVATENKGFAVGGGAGGVGGDGVDVAIGSIGNTGAIYGGTGGTGGTAGVATGGAGPHPLLYPANGGTGGVGGVGASIASGTMTNSGSVTGGVGGTGGAGAVQAGSAAGAGGRGGAGVNLSGGTLFNSGYVLGGDGGTGGLGSGGPAANGTNGDGIDVSGGGVVVNQTGGLIDGFYGIYQDKVGASAVSVTTYGTIIAASHSVVFNNSADRLTVMDGSNFTGEILGGGGTLELGAAQGTIVGLGSTGTLSGEVRGRFTGFDAYVVDAGDSWTLSGASSVGAGQSLTNAGDLSVAASSSLTVTGGLSNSGKVVLDGGAGGAYAGLVFSGAQTLSGGGTVSLTATGYIAGSAAGDSLSNADNTITGAGIIKGPLAFTNEAAGVIDTSAGTMGINLQDTLVNDGLIESTGTGTLFIRFTTIDSSGGGSIVDGKRLWLDASVTR